MEKREHLYFAGGNVKYEATWENSLVVPQGVQHGPSNSIPTFMSNRDENTCPHKNMALGVHSIIHSSQKVETT